MATTLYFRNAVASTHLGTNNTKLAGSTSGWVTKALSTSRGTTATSQDVATVTGPTSGLEIDTVNGPIEWISEPLDQDITLSGNVTTNLCAAESAMAVNAAICVIIQRLNSVGGIVSTIGQSTDTEIGTSEAPENLNFAITSTNMLKGDRIRIRVYADDATGLTMGAGTVTFWYDGPTAAASGDSYITFTETFDFETTTTVPNFTYAQGATAGSNIAGAGPDWSTPGNITANDSNSATVVTSGTASDYLLADFSSFGLPSESRIIGISAEVDLTAAPAGVSVALTKDGSTPATASKTTSSGAGNKVLGGQGDLWNATWTVAEIEAATFGVLITAPGTAGTYSVDYVVIRIYTWYGSILFPTSVTPELTYGPGGLPALLSSFTGANEDPISEGGNWAQLNSSGNPLKRVSNALTTGFNAGASYWTPANFGPNVEAYVTISTLDDILLCARVQNEGGANTWDGYQVVVTTTQTILRRVDSDAGSTSYIQLAIETFTWGVGDKIGISCYGSTIQAWRQASGSSRWDLRLSAVDTTYASAGKIALVLGGITPVAVADDLYAGTDTRLFIKNSPVLISDFTGSDENPLSEGGNWAALNTSIGNFQRISNEAGGAGVSNNATYWTQGNFGPDLEAYITINASGTFGIAFRIQGEGGAGTWDGYSVTSAPPTTLNITRYDNGVATDLITTAEIAATWAAGDKFGVRVVGNTIQAWQLDVSAGSVWRLIATATDSTYPSAGKIGLISFGTASRGDDLYAATNSNLFTQKAWTARGNGVVNYRAKTGAGWTAPLLTHEWFTPQLQAFTLGDLVRFNLRLLENDPLADVSVRVELAVTNGDGTNPIIWASGTKTVSRDNGGGELNTVETAAICDICGDDLSVTNGQRLRFRVYLEDTSDLPMVGTGGYYASNYYNGTTIGASGDSWIQLSQFITELPLSLMPPVRRDRRIVPLI